VIGYVWDMGVNDWVPAGRGVKTYDANGNTLEQLYFVWELEINDWVPAWRNINIFDNEGNQIEWNYSNWDTTYNDWVYKNKMVSFWSELTTSYPIQSYELSLDIYPNPTKDQLIIKTDQPDHLTIEITAINGQLIYQTSMDKTTKQIDFSRFSKGAYLITIRSKEFVRTEKIVKL